MAWLRSATSVALIIGLSGAATARGQDLILVKPTTAVVHWSDDTYETMYATNPAACHSIMPSVNSGLWVPVGRPNQTVLSVDCRPGGPTPGGDCIQGYNCR